PARDPGAREPSIRRPHRRGPRRGAEQARPRRVDRKDSRRTRCQLPGSIRTRAARDARAHALHSLLAARESGRRARVTRGERRMYIALAARNSEQRGAFETAERHPSRGAGSMPVEMKIKGLMIDPVSNMPIIVLKKPDGEAVLPIWVGIFE